MFIKILNFSSRLIAYKLTSINCSCNCSLAGKSFTLLGTINMDKEKSNKWFQIRTNKKTKEITVLLFFILTTFNVLCQNGLSKYTTEKFETTNSQTYTVSSINPNKSGYIAVDSALYFMESEESIKRIIISDSLIDSSTIPVLKNNQKQLNTIPFCYHNKLIKLKIGIQSGEIKHEFILDTGAPTIIIDSLVDIYDLKWRVSEPINDVNGNTQINDFYYIKSIEIGNKQIKDIKAASNNDVDEMPILKGYKGVGLLGANVMKNSIWQINYKNKEITLTDSLENLQLDENFHFAKMKTDELNRPIIIVTIAGKCKLDFIVDLGYNGSILLPDNYFSKPIFNDSMTYSIEEKYSTGYETKIKTTEYKFLKKITIGNMELENVKVSASGNRSTALIGNEFLEKYIIVMDFVNKNMAFLPSEKQREILCC